MEYYAVLIVSTVIIVALALVLYQTRRDCGLLVGIAALYYWSLYGAWSLVIDKSGGFSGKYYHYLEFKMFPIALDDNYLISIALYGAFIIVVELTLLAAVSTTRVRRFPRLVLRHEPILLLGSLAAAASMLIMRDKLGTAWATNTSAYWYTRSQPGDWFTLHQVLNRVALIPPAIGAGSLAAGAQSRYFVNVVRAHTWPCYAALLGSMCAFTFVLGNKNEVLSALIAGFLAYVASAERPRWVRAGLGATVGVWFLYTIDLFRGTPLSGLWAAVTERLGEATDVGRFVSSSNEAFAAHFSMYGVLAARTPVKFGYSLYSLACSLVPRVLWPERPRDIYLYYSESVGAIQNQGYSLHHATGWYLNFGYPGVLLGGVVLGLVWAGCLNAHRRFGGRRGMLVRLFAVVAPWTFAANVAPLVRAGPEGYKGFLIDAALIPVGALAFACYQKKRAGQAAARPVGTVPGAGLLPRPGTGPHAPVFDPGARTVQRPGGAPRAAPRTPQPEPNGPPREPPREGAAG